MKILFTSKQYISIASVIVMLAAWKLLALHFDSDFVVPHPEKTFVTVLKLFTEKGFVTIVGTTIFRGVFGFVLSFILGMGFGILAGVSANFNAFLRPILVTVRSVPVIALILLALIWLSPGSVPVFIAMLTMFPFICTNVIDGINSVDSSLAEMAGFYKIGHKRIIREVYIPAIMPFIISGASSAMGIGWRAIIIGEVLSQPTYGIGTIMQAAQTFLNVDAVIAWTIIAVVISYVFEKLIRWSERKIVNWKK
ncbi:MAG: ABC transporter permease subunit [Prolixibacteraceae bacterium]|nr:ABC transporter permease subunit [Prolixibacteraceae bacterium]